MHRLALLALVGLVAQLVDGSLGLAYGATSTSLLLLVGLTPAVASASVHLSEIGTTLVSGAAHQRFGNVDRRLVLLLGVPGAVGAFAGATLLAGLSTRGARPLMALVLALIGVRLLVRRGGGSVDPRQHRPLPARALGPIGLVAGFVDATGGGGWGPLTTPTLLVTGRVDARRVIGSVDAAEFLVAIAASVGFVRALGAEAFAVPVVVALLLGGVVAAPLAAWLVRHLPLDLLGASVGGLLLVTNVGPGLGAVGAPLGAAAAGTALSVVAWGVALLVAVRRRGRPSVAQQDVPAGV